VQLLALPDLLNGVEAIAIVSVPAEE